jgi:hypothetical protein
MAGPAGPDYAQAVPGRPLVVARSCVVLYIAAGWFVPARIAHEEVHLHLGWEG